MRCYVRKYNEKLDRYSYFAKNWGENENHWVQLKQEAREFNNVKEARWAIKKYRLKNCEVEKCQKKD